MVTRGNGKIPSKNYPAQIKIFMSSVLSCTLSSPLAQINPCSQRKTNSWFFRLLSQHLQPVILKSALTGLCYQQRLFQKDPPLWKMPNLICLMFLPQRVPLLLETFSFEAQIIKGVLNEVIDNVNCPWGYKRGRDNSRGGW